MRMLFLALVFAMAAPLAAQRKSPVMAAAFSAAVPGAGQVYAGDWGRGALVLGTMVALEHYRVAAAHDTSCPNGCRTRSEAYRWAMIGTWAFGVVDAALTAGRVNARVTPSGLVVKVATR